MTVFEDALNRLATKYNGNGYDPSTNPGGLDNGGHTINLVPALHDIATAGEGVADLAETATTAAATATTKASEASTSAGLAATAKTAAESARDVAQSTVLPLGGECRLGYASATVLTLSRYNGYRLVIDNVARAIPASGVTLSNSGVSDTTYYIYAYWTGSTIALEYSTTGHSADSRNGVRVKAVDATRSLVGMARTDASGTWVDSAAQRFVISWYNPQQKPIGYTLAADVSTSSPTAIPVTSDTSLQFLSFGSDLVNVSFSILAACSIASTFHTFFFLNGTATSQAVIPIPYASGSAFVSTSKVMTPSTGLNYIQIYGISYGGTCTWKGWETTILGTIGG